MASIGFIGVGKLGQACAEMVAEVHDVVGYDINPVEPENFAMVDKMEDAVKGKDIVFVAVQTPHDPQYDGKKNENVLKLLPCVNSSIMRNLSAGNKGNDCKNWSCGTI